MIFWGKQHGHFKKPLLYRCEVNFKKQLHEKVVILCASVAALAACDTTSTQANAPVQEAVPVQESKTAQLKLVSWNIEHLADDIGKGCKPRSEADYAKLASYAKTLNADIVALQEVQSENALKRVFPDTDWQYVVSTRPDNQSYECRGTDGLLSTPQRTAIVIRKGIDFNVNDDFKALALDNPGCVMAHQLVLAITS